MTEVIRDTGKAGGIPRLGNAFCDAQALLTAVGLGLFTVLRPGGLSEKEIRQRLGLHGRGLSDWLCLLVDLELLKREGDRFHNKMGADHSWERFAEALRTGRPQSGSDFSEMIENPNPGGALLAYDRMLDEGSSHVENLVISLDMLLVTDGGSEYTGSELWEHTLAAEFVSIEDQPLGDYDTLVICHKQSSAARCANNPMEGVPR